MPRLSGRSPDRHNLRDGTVISDLQKRSVQAIVNIFETGRPLGFAFVTMESPYSMMNAIKALDGKELDGRLLKVNEAGAREDRGQGDGSIR